MIRVGFFREQKGMLQKVAETTVADTSTNAPADAWRQVGRTVDLPEGTYQVMAIGRRGRLESTRTLRATDLGAVP
jgi:hypothetical protein